jgi:DNA polymerase-3 subunit beta
MKISISKQELFNKLRTSVNLLDSLNSNPIMDCLLIDVDEKQLIIISSNVFSSLRNTTTELTISKPGKVLVKGKILYNIISKIKEKMVDLELVDNSILRISTTSFLCDINTLDHSPYPDISFDIRN